MAITNEPVGSTFRNLGERFDENLNRTMRRREATPGRRGFAGEQNELAPRPRGFAGEQNPQDAAAAPSIPRRADADMENTMPQPFMGAEPRPAPSVANLNAARTEANRRRQNTRSTARMSPRRESDELNEIAQSITARRGGAEMEPGRTGDIARRISNRAAEVEQERQAELAAMKRGGPVKKMAKGGVVSSSASSRSDGCAMKGKTRGRMV